MRECVGQHPVERGVGEHDAQAGIARRHALGHAVAAGRISLLFSQQQDGGLGPGERVGFGPGDVHVVPGHGQVRKEHGKGFPGPAFSFSKPGHRGLIAGVHQQLETTQTLQGHDGSGGQGHDRTLQRVRPFGQGAARGIQECQARPAHRTGNGLGVEPAVPGFVVLGGARVTQGERLHGRVRAVVREAFDDRIAGSARRAVGEGVPVPPGPGVAHLGLALRADRQVGRQAGHDVGVLAARHDGKTRFLLQEQFRGLDVIQVRGLRVFRAERGQEPFHGVHMSLDLDADPGRAVSDKTGQSQIGRDPVDKGSKADSLHHTGHIQSESCPHVVVRFEGCSRGSVCVLRTRITAGLAGHKNSMKDI